MDTTSGHVRFDTSGAAIAAVIEAFFGAMWFSWGQADDAIPGWLTWVDSAGSVICILVLLLAGWAAWRARAEHGAMADPGVRRRYGLIVGGEVVVLVAGAAVLGVAGASAYIAAWVAAGVGVHFFPLSALFGTRQLQVLGAAVTLVALAALVVGLTTTTEPSSVTGPGAGLCLLVGALASLASIQQYRARGRVAAGVSPAP